MWVTSQRAEQMMTAHWPVAPGAVAALVSPTVSVETFDRTAWVTIIGMHVADARPHFLPPVDPLSSFTQVGVRTYVRVGDRPAAWIFAVQAGGRLGAFLARSVFRLPVERADTRLCVDVDGTTQLLTRGRSAGIAASYAAVGPATTPAPGSLTAFLGERDLVVSGGRNGRVWLARVDHEPVPVAPARVAIADDTLMPLAIRPAAPPVLAHSIASMRTHAWLPRHWQPGRRGLYAPTSSRHLDG